MAYVYVISEGSEGPCKIGMAVDPAQRRRELQTGNPRKLDLAWQIKLQSRAEAKRIEDLAHLYLYDLTLKGEWFDACPSLAIEAVTEYCR